MLGKSAVYGGLLNRDHRRCLPQLLINPEKDESQSLFITFPIPGFVETAVIQEYHLLGEFIYLLSDGYH
jgi:hypothetical protein